MRRQPPSIASHYASKARVIQGLRRYFQHFGEAPRSGVAYSRFRQEDCASVSISFPSAGQVMRHFSDFYSAWAATGIDGALPHCQCGGILNSYRARCCEECASRHRSDGARRHASCKYPFTPDNDRSIERLYVECGAKAKKARLITLAAHLGYPLWAVRKRARALGLHAPKEPIWCDAELALLERYVHLGPDAIARRLKRAGFVRSVNGINLMAKRLDLRKDAPFYSGFQLARLLGVDSHVVAGWAKQGILPYTTKDTARVAVQGEVRLFHELDVYLFLCSHRVYDIRKCDQSWLLAMLIDFPAANTAAIARRQALSGAARDSEALLQWSPARWKQCRASQRKQRAARAAA